LKRPASGRVRLLVMMQRNPGIRIINRRTSTAAEIIHGTEIAPPTERETLATLDMMTAAEIAVCMTAMHVTTIAGGNVTENIAIMIAENIGVGVTVRAIGMHQIHADMIVGRLVAGKGEMGMIETTKVVIAPDTAPETESMNGHRTLTVGNCDGQKRSDIVKVSGMKIN
jgi:hypothetical protein